MLQKTSIYKIFFLTTFFFLLGCYQNKIDPIDREAGLTRQEARSILLKDKSQNDKIQQQNQVKIQDSESPIPKISQIITPPPPRIGSGKIISFSVTDQVSLKDVLIELGRKADIDVDVDPTISGSIILNAKDRPLSEVIERIATLGNLRYTYKDNILYFERNAPYLKHYSVDYLIDGTLWSEVLTNINSIISIPDSIQTTESSNNTPSATVTANKSAGIISVYATTKQHKNVEKYLAEVQKNASAQVLIEAKVVEVTLNDYYSSGVDWTNFFNADVSNKSSGNGFSLAGDATDILSNSIGTPVSVAISDGGLGLDVTVKLLQQFGIVKAISSPRIHAVNNQAANLNFIDKLVYFKLEIEQSDASNGSTTTTVQKTITSTKEEADVGVKLGITPSINLKTQEITMKIKPEISIQSDSKKDPATAIAAEEAGLTDLTNSVPVIQSRTLETVMKIKSGGVLVIGGLMKQNVQNVDTGIPYLSEIPVLGNLFKGVTKKQQTIETVIFIKATIVNSNGLVDESDRKFHEGFTVDNKDFLKQK